MEIEMAGFHLPGLFPWGGRSRAGARFVGRL